MKRWVIATLSIVLIGRLAGYLSLPASPDGFKSGREAAQGKLTKEGISKGAIYYVDAVNGNDKNSGRKPSEAWRTLRKAAETMAPGDVCYVRGGIYRETVKPKDGQTFVAYRDEKPLITGCDPVSGWTVYSGHIYKAAIPLKVYDVFVGGEYMHKARWPNFNGDYLDTRFWVKGFASKTNGVYRVVLDTPPPANLVGGWYYGIHGVLNYSPQEGRIIAINGREIILTDARDDDWFWTDPQHSGSGVGYITDALGCLDAEKEWHWENGTLYLWAPGGGMPRNVEARTRIYGFILSNRSNVTIKGLYFLGASILIDGGSNNILDGCHFRNVSPWGNAKAKARGPTNWGSPEDGTAGVYISGKNHIIQNCSFVGGWGSGIRIEGGSDIRVRNNYLEDFGWLGRMMAAPISGFGTRLRIEHNTIRKSGGCGIILSQKNPGDFSNVNHVRYPQIKYNRIEDVAYLLLDGGSCIYISNGDVPSEERWLKGEIAFNLCLGLQSRSTEGYFWGIYIDNGTDFVTIHHNIIHSLNPNRGYAGIFLHAAQHREEDIFCYHNTIWGHFQDAISASAWGKGSISNVVFRNNLASGTGFRAILNPGVIADHNRENVPLTEFVSVANSDFRLNSSATQSIDRGVVIPGINDANSESPYVGNAPDLGAYEYKGVNWAVGSTVRPPAFPKYGTSKHIKSVR